jgi:hypothetical protein
LNFQKETVSWMYCICICYFCSSNNIWHFQIGQVAWGGPMQTASSANLTCKLSTSAVE